MEIPLCLTRYSFIDIYNYAVGLIIQHRGVLVGYTKKMINCSVTRTGKYRKLYIITTYEFIFFCWSLVVCKVLLVTVLCQIFFFFLVIPLSLLHPASSISDINYRGLSIFLYNVGTLFLSSNIFPCRSFVLFRDSFIFILYFTSKT